MKLKSFEEFLAKNIVRKQTPNRHRALSLLNEAEEKNKFLEISLRNIPSEQMSPNFIVEHCYDVIIELVRAKMFLDGFNSGNSHEAEVSYMEKLEFPKSEVVFMDELRYYRNGIKYYGKILDKEYADKVLTFMKKTFPKLVSLIAK